jgi:hypothetical protein
MKRDISSSLSEGKNILKELEIVLEKYFCANNKKTLKKTVQILQKTYSEIQKRDELKII